MIKPPPPPPALLRAEDGADSQWCGWGGEKSGQFKLKDLRVAGSSCMEVWHTICMYHGNSGAPGAAGVSHRGARVVCLFNLAPFPSTCFAKNKHKHACFNMRLLNLLLTHPKSKAYGLPGHMYTYLFTQMVV